MYRVLKSLPTIINYIDWWRCETCPCGQEIDVAWQPDVGDVDTTHWFFRHCPECVIRAAPEDSQQGWRGQYRRLRAERVSLGLGRPVSPPDYGVSPTDLSEDARESLHWPSGPITLHGVRRTEPGSNLIL